MKARDMGKENGEYESGKGGSVVTVSNMTGSDFSAN